MRRRGLFVSIVLVALVSLAVAASGCAADGGDEAKGPIRVGSKIDVEGPILGRIIISVLEENGFVVEDKTRTGTTDVVRKALLAGEIDVYPEYTANALTVFHSDQDIDASILKSAELTYEKAKELDAEEDVFWARPAPANNTWAVAVPRAYSEENGLQSLTDLAAFIKEGGDVKVVGSQEFFDREDAMPAFEKAYGFKLGSDQKIVLATGDTAVTEKAAAEGANGANAAMAYGTDGTIAALDMVVLSDPQGVQPIYQPAPILRQEVVNEFPELETLFDEVFDRLDIVTLQELNAAVAVEGKDAAAVADDWLRSQGFIE